MRIAIVEDEQPLAKALKRGLESEDNAVELFFTASSAKETLTNSGNSYDLVILDLMLPDGDGALVCTDLRSAGIHTPILVLTARDSTEDKVNLLDRGADDFLAKPFSFEELLARSRALSRRAGSEMEYEIVLGDLRVEPGSRSVWREGKPVSLTAREFDFLLYLLRNRGRVVGREELLSKVWKQNAPSGTNVLDVHMRHLREKLEDYDQTILQTVHGAGYTVPK